jgi:hypothetical protein
MVGKSRKKKYSWELKVFLGNLAGNCSAFAFNSKRKIGTRFFVVFRIEKKTMSRTGYVGMWCFQKATEILSSKLPTHVKSDNSPFQM